MTKKAEAIYKMSSEAFLRDLHAFMERIGQPILKMPSLGYQELDLLRLFKLVLARGGMDEVTRKQEWKLVYQDLGLSTMSTSASYNTRTNYKKYLYLYELEVCDWGEEAPSGMQPLFQVGSYVRIVSSTYEGQVFYAQISKYRYRNGSNMYYVHYNGWSTSHDEWMPEAVLERLRPEEERSPADLTNPSPTRSSKSNYIIYDPLVSERHHHPGGPAASGAATGDKAMPRKRKPTKAKPGHNIYYPNDDQLYDEDEDESAMLLEEFAQSSPLAASSYKDDSSPSQTTRLGTRSRPRGSGDRSTLARHPNALQTLHEQLEHFMDEEHFTIGTGKCGMFGSENMNLPTQVFYNGGRWKHTTPKVRKFHLHRYWGARQSSFPFDAKLLDTINTKLHQHKPSLGVLPPIAKVPSPISMSASLKASPVVAKARALLSESPSTDKRSIRQLEESISASKSALKAISKAYRGKMRLLDKFYGLGSRSAQVAALLSGPKSLRR